VFSNPWVDGIVTGAAILTALGVIWRQAFRPVWRGLRRIEEAVPILLAITEQFEPNGGNSLRDTVDRIEARLVDGKAQMDSQGKKLDALHKYSHDARHERISQIEGLRKFDEAINRKVDTLAAKLEPVPDQVTDIQEKVT
jgi:hypothetical protein